MSLPDGEPKAGDAAYFGERHYEEPKESFKRVVDAIIAAQGDGPLSLVDVGCATGGFLHHARTRLHLSEAVGVDVDETYLEQAHRHVPEAEFVADSILDLGRLGEREFDVCTCIGTLALFDDLELVLRRLLSLRRRTGSVYLYDLVNAHPVDVVMRYRDLDEEGQPWRPGFNVSSRKTYLRVVERIDPALTVEFTDFEVPFELPFAEPLRAWTVEVDGVRRLMVGTGQILPFTIVRIGPPR